MRFALFYHSLISDWNHGNAHFLRGVTRELLARGHDVRVYEPLGGWSLSNLLREQPDALADFRRFFPMLSSRFYDPESLALEKELNDVDVVLVHEWNCPELVRRLGRFRRAHGGFRLLFHDTHHRCVTAPEQMRAYDLREYDGVLAFGSIIRDWYLKHGRTGRAWTWHEAADTHLFRPLDSAVEGDLVWIGNWGDGERSEEIRDYFVEPVRGLDLRASAYGVRYPDEAVAALAAAGIRYSGWVANHRVPAVFARHRVTAHIPRRPYRERLPGIPTIRVFEALACGIPLVCLNWEDSEELFRPGEDYLTVGSSAEMTEALHAVLNDDALAKSLSDKGQQTILNRHTCAHRIDELLDILQQIEGVDKTDASRPRNSDASRERRSVVGANVR